MFFIACSNPLKAIVIGHTDEGKKKLLFDATAYDNGFWHGHEVPDDFKLLIPCGQCAECRMQRSREWANRCMMELQYHDSAYFVTLTYNPEHVPQHFYPDPQTGEACVSYSLYKRDWQLFMKRLRKRFPDDKLRFYMCGEYGPKTHRPHYHAIIFGLHLDDLKLSKNSTRGYSYYESEALNSCWIDTKDRFPENPDYLHDGMQMGFVCVGKVEWRCCAYTARYIMKKLTGDEAKFYETFNIEPEFTLMSRMPGIGRQYYDDHPDIYKHEFINIGTESTGLKFKPPRYFDKLFDVDDHDEMERIKTTRKKFAVEAETAKLKRTNLSREELNEVSHRQFMARINTLRRNLE